MKFSLRQTRLSRSLGRLLAMTVGFLTPGHALVEDAHIEAIELAGPIKKKGFKIREDFWSGT